MPKCQICRKDFKTGGTKLAPDMPADIAGVFKSLGLDLANAEICPKCEAFRKEQEDLFAKGVEIGYSDGTKETVSTNPANRKSRS